MSIFKTLIPHTNTQLSWISCESQGPKHHLHIPLWDHQQKTKYESSHPYARWSVSGKRVFLTSFTGKCLTNKHMIDTGELRVTLHGWEDRRGSHEGKREM